MPHITRDSAWRQWKGACRDLTRAEQRKREARDTYMIVLLTEFEQRRADADEAGQDIDSDDALASLGMPCLDCMEPYSGGVWVEAALGGAQAETRRWGELVYQFGPISDVQPRCEMVCYLGEGSSGEILDRCLLALGHHDHHKLPPERWSQP
jgi:hypothetical protein